MSRLRDLSFIREIETQNSFERTFEIRRIIKSKINAEFLSDFKDKLKNILDDGEFERYDL